jgi:hypothetical protein|nr:MAG TPA: minor structural protein [Caudoviricetes sp.]DAV00733.1 MAG TPA: minor structural protein [Caudoviricetes sp.]
MLKVITELEKLGLELTDEQKESVKKNIGEEVYSKGEFEKKVRKAEDERDQYKTRAETAEETLKGFDGKDFETITKERDEWKEKAETAKKDYDAKIAEREKNDLLKEAFESVKFSSESAKKAVMADIAASVTVKDGKLIGFNDLLEDAKKNDAGAFVDEQEQQSEQNQATFTAPMGAGTKTEPITGDPNKMDFATYKKWREQNQ